MSTPSDVDRDQPLNLHKYKHAARHILPHMA